MTERADHKRELNALAFVQAGYFTAHQARTVGFSYQAQKYHVDRGNWTKIDRGLFRLPGWPPDKTDVFTRWCVWSEGKGVISHQSAAVLHGFALEAFQSGAVHMTMPPGSSSRNTQVILHVGMLVTADVDVVGPLRVTSPTRTSIDLAASVPQDQLNVVIREAVNNGRVDAVKLRSDAEKLRGHHSRKILDALNTS